MSSLASGLVTVELRWNMPMSIGRRWGSTSTSLQTLLRRDVRRFWMPSCLCETKPFFLHHRAWLTVNGSPHAQWLDKSASCRSYCQRGESLNCCLFNDSSCSSRATALSHAPAPLSLACSVDLRKSSCYTVLLLTLRQRIAVRLQISGLVYPDPLVNSSRNSSGSGSV